MRQKTVGYNKIMMELAIMTAKNGRRIWPEWAERKSRRTIEASCGQTEISKPNRGSLPTRVNTYTPSIGALPQKGKESQRPEIKRARS